MHETKYRPKCGSDEAGPTTEQSLNEKSAHYVTPFDKFIPHENLLPELDPSVEAALLASNELDPVRGEMEDKKFKEEFIMKCLNYPDFEKVYRDSEEVRKEINENMLLWHAMSPTIKHEKPTEDETMLLDYATLCNIYAGTWGVDEDSMMLKFFYKFQYDDAWRGRLKNGCFNMIDECIPGACGVCKPVTNADMASMKEEFFFEIEDKDDYNDTVVTLKEEFNKLHEKETNWEFTQYIMNPVDSDLDDDPFVTEEELTLCERKRPSSKEWIGAKEVFSHDFRPFATEGPGEAACEDIINVKLKDILPHRDVPSLEEETINLIKNKFNKYREDHKKGILWRPKTNYHYRLPDFRRKNPKGN